MEKIPAPFDGKNLIDDSLRDDVFGGFYECYDMKNGRTHVLGHVNIDTFDDDGIFLDGIVDAQWGESVNTVRIELKACQSRGDYYSARGHFFRYYEQLFRGWERDLKQNCYGSESASVEFRRDGNVLYVSFWWIA